MSWVKKLDNLEDCKKFLESLLEIIKDQIFIPQFLDSLIDDILESHYPEEIDNIVTNRKKDRRDALREKIEDVLNDLFIEYSSIFPFQKTLETYLLNKQDYSENLLDQLKKFQSIMNWNIDMDSNFFKEVEKFASRWRDEKFNPKKIPLSEVPSLPTILNKLNLKVLDIHYAYAHKFFDEMISHYLLNYFSYIIILRTIIEHIINGILFEHLLISKYRKEVIIQGKMQSSLPYYKRDKVPMFLKEIEEKSKKMGQSSIDILITPETYDIRTPKIYDTIEWLNHWNVFEPIKNADEKLKAEWKDLSKLLHAGDLERLSLRYGSERIVYPSLFIQKLNSLLDILMVGILNTIRHLSYKKLITLYNTPGWKRLIENFNESNFSSTKDKLKNLFR